MWTIDAEDRTTYVNRAMATMLGWTPLEMLGRSMYAFIYEGYATGAERLLSSRGLGDPERREFPLRHRHGFVVWGEMSASPLRDADGAYLGSMAFVRDVTERRRLVEERERLIEDLAVVADVVDRAPVCIHVYDERGFSNRMNEAQRQLMGLPEGRVDSSRFNCLTDPAAVRTGLSARMARAYAGEVVTAEFALDVEAYADWKVHGGKLWVEQLVYPIRRADGRVVGAVTMTQDVTARKRVEAAVAESQRLESLGQLAGGVAHDFNNLFAALLGHVDVSLGEPLTPPPTRTALERIADITHRAADLTRQLLAFAGGGPTHAESLDLNGVVRDTVEILRLTTERPPPFELSLPDGPLPVDADAGQLRQVVLNLVHNAMEAIPAEGGRIHIRTGSMALATGEGWRGRVGPGVHAFVEVRDNGAGVPTELHGRIFEPFFSTRSAGRGLGLSAALGIARNHSGGIRLESPPGRGATFVVALPLGATTTATVAAPLSPMTPMISADRALVLVVDDDEGVLEVLERMLELSGYATVSARDGVEALERFEASPDAFAAVILDLLMPRMGGAEAYQRIRAARPRQPVLLCSGFAPTTIRVPPPEDTHARFLGKPFRRQELHGALADLIHKRR